MAHELEIDGNGNAQVMLDRVAWHELGTVVPDGFTMADAIASGMSFTLPVEIVPMSTLTLGYDDYAAPEFASVRGDGRILKTGLGANATVFHALEAHEFGQALIGMVDGSRMSSFGSLRNGRQWFQTFALATFAVGGHEMTSHLTLAGSYDGSLAFVALRSNIITVCANTLAMNLGGGSRAFSTKHTTHIADRVEWARRVLSSHEALELEERKRMEYLALTRLAPTDVTSILDELWPIGEGVSTKAENANLAAREGVRRIHSATDGHDVMLGEQGTAWGLVQAVNTYENWGTPIRKQAGMGDREARGLRQFDSIVKGQPLTDKVLALVGGGEA